MSLDELWHAYRTAGYEAVRIKPKTEALAHFYLALLAFGENDLVQAAESARAAAEAAPDHLVFRHAITYLDRLLDQGKEGVYVSGEAFAAFIRGGGNVNLYRAISESLRQIYQEYEMLSLLDVGVGDGLALLPALTSNITRLDVLDPSEAMLSRTSAELNSWSLNYHAYQSTIQEFIRQPGSEHWDIIQATWSLQSVPPDERLAVFRWARERGQRLLIAEFDVPDFADLYDPVRVRFIVERYRQGLAEYVDDGGLVAQGFLLPVMFGYFDRSAARTNYEVPIQTWVDGVRTAGFADVHTSLLYPYWWANAYLIDARV